MSDFLTYLEQDLVDAARRRAVPIATRRRRPVRSLALAAALALGVGGTATAATLIVLRGSVIPAPSERDAGPGQTAAPGSAKVLPLRAGDPGGGPAWALRVAKSKTGLTCTTVGQEVGGEFGVVGLDGRFRKLADGVVDACGAAGTTLVGARVFDASATADIRTVVNGVAGDGLRAATLSADGRDRRLPIGTGGSFIVALAGRPEDAAVAITLRFADGHVERHDLGASPYITRDPAGAGAWKLENTRIKHDNCVALAAARTTDRAPLSRAACGDIDYPRQAHGYYLAFEQVNRSTVPTWTLPERTIVYGQAARPVVRIQVLGPGRALRTVPIAPNKGFLAVYPPNVSPRALSVRITFDDGSVKTVRRNTNLTRPLTRLP